jgi:NAD(P)-dependent dehydrogenase (short-subunit alcohol dehydrogenase family)
VSRGTLADHAEDLQAFRDVLETNVLGIVHTFHPFMAPMREAGRGALVGVASLAGFRGIPGSAAYSASKAAAIALLESLRVELRGSGVARRHDRAGLRRHADDGAQSVQDAVPDGSRPRGGVDRARDRAAQALPRAAVADGDRRTPVPRVARPLYDRAFRERPAQAAPAVNVRLGGRRARARRRRRAHRLPGPEPHRAPVRAGAGERVVARTGFCVHPRDAVRRVPKVGGTKDVDLDALRTARPTHLVVNVDENRARPSTRRARSFRT